MLGGHTIAANQRSNKERKPQEEPKHKKIVYEVFDTVLIQSHRNVLKVNGTVVCLVKHGAIDVTVVK